MLAHWSPGRRIAAAALVSFGVAIVVITLFRGLSNEFPVRIVQVLACSVVAVGAVGAVLAAVTGRLADYREPADDEEFERLVRHSERLAEQRLAAEPDDDDFLARDPFELARDPYDPRDFEL